MKKPEKIKDKPHDDDVNFVKDSLREASTIKTRAPTPAYRKGWERIFGKGKRK